MRAPSGDRSWFKLPNKLSSRVILPSSPDHLGTLSLRQAAPPRAHRATSANKARGEGQSDSLDPPMQVRRGGRTLFSLLALGDGLLCGVHQAGVAIYVRTTIQGVVAANVVPRVKRVVALFPVE